MAYAACRGELPEAFLRAPRSVAPVLDARFSEPSLSRARSGLRGDEGFLMDSPSVHMAQPAASA